MTQTPILTVTGTSPTILIGVGKQIKKKRRKEDRNGIRNVAFSECWEQRRNHFLCFFSPERGVGKQSNFFFFSFLFIYITEVAILAQMEGHNQQSGATWDGLEIQLFYNLFTYKRLDYLDTLLIYNYYIDIHRHLLIYSLLLKKQ